MCEYLPVNGGGPSRWFCGYCGESVLAEDYYNDRRDFTCGCCGLVVTWLPIHLRKDVKVSHSITTPVQRQMPRSRLALLDGCLDV